MSKIVGKQNIEATTTLTGSYVAADEVLVENAYEGVLNVTYISETGQSGRVLYVKVMTSPDKAGTYYQETSYTVSSGTVTHTVAEHLFTGATGGVSYVFTISIPLAHKYLKVYTKEDGSANWGSVAITLSTSEEV